MSMLRMVAWGMVHRDGDTMHEIDRAIEAELKPTWIRIAWRPPVGGFGPFGNPGRWALFAKSDAITCEYLGTSFRDCCQKAVELLGEHT